MLNHKHRLIFKGINKLRKQNATENTSLYYNNKCIVYNVVGCTSGDVYQGFTLQKYFRKNHHSSASQGKPLWLQNHFEFVVSEPHAQHKLCVIICCQTSEVRLSLLPASLPRCWHRLHGAVFGTEASRGLQGS